MDIVRHAGADEIFAGARSADRAALVIGVNACAHQRRITNAAWVLVGHSAGGYGACQVACAVQGNRAHGAKLAGFVQRGGMVHLHGRASCILQMVELGQPMFRMKVAGRHDLKAVVAGELLGPIAAEQYKFGIHHRARQLHRVAQRAHAHHRPGRQRRPVHHSGIHLVLRSGGVDRSAPGVEQRIVLQYPHRRHYRV